MSTRFGTLRGVRPAGGGRTNTWTVLDSDSESETVPLTPVKKSTRTVVPAAPKKSGGSSAAAAAVDLATMFASDLDFQQMLEGKVPWGDLLCPMDRTTPPPIIYAAPAPRDPEAEFWSAPWADKIHEKMPDIYDTSELSDVEYNDMMSWLYRNGWWVGDFERSWVSFEPDTMPPRRWCPPSEDSVKVVRFGPTTTCCGHGHKKEKKADNAPILRFCRAGAGCAEEGCRYVHGDTIPRVDRPCAFGASCGAADPTGVKRSQCLYMHPGETWSAELVIRRPPTA